MSPITTLFSAACAVAVIEANSSHGNVRSAIDFLILDVSFISHLKKVAAS
jgi:hypothetical protein